MNTWKKWYIYMKKDIKKVAEEIYNFCIQLLAQV